jgi:DDE family transposase
VFNQFGDLERCSLRPVRQPAPVHRPNRRRCGRCRYQGKVSRIYFRADAGFANPEVYDFLEAEWIKYAIRLSANSILQERIGHLLTRPIGRPPNEVRRSARAMLVTMKPTRGERARLSGHFVKRVRNGDGLEPWELYTYDPNDNAGRSSTRRRRVGRFETGGDESILDTFSFQSSLHYDAFGKDCLGDLSTTPWLAGRSPATALRDCVAPSEARRREGIYGQGSAPSTGAKNAAAAGGQVPLDDGNHGIFWRSARSRPAPTPVHRTQRHFRLVNNARSGQIWAGIGGYLGNVG